jgi:hypothetical protein
MNNLKEAYNKALDEKLLRLIKLLKEKGYDSKKVVNDMIDSLAGEKEKALS